MTERSQFTLSVELKFNDAIKILEKIDQIISMFGNPGDILSTGKNYFQPNMQMGRGFLTKNVKEAFIVWLATQIAKKVYQTIMEKPPTEYEKLLQLRSDVFNDKLSVENALKQGDLRGAYTPEGLPRNTEYLQRRLDVLDSFYERINELIEVLDRGEIRSINPIPKFGQPGEVIINPIDDRIKDLLKEYEKIRKDEAGRLEEFKNSVYGSALEELSLLNNALAMTGDTSLIFAGNQDIVSDANNGVLASALQLRKEGLDPLSGTTKESGEAMIDFLSSFEDGGLIFGYTKEQLLGVGSVAKEASKSTKDLGKNGIKVVADQAKQAEPKLDSLNSTTEGIKDNAETLDKTLKEGKGAITGYGTEAQSTADKGLTKLEGKIGDVKEAAKGLNLTGMNEVIPGLPFPTEKINQDIVAVADTFEETNKSAQNSLDELGVFAADIASEINETFADLIFRGLKGNLDSLSEFWDATFDAMLNTFAQFAATVISNPIRIALDAVLRGESGSGEGEGGGKGFFGTLGGVFDIGKGFKTIGKGLMKIPGVSSIVDGITGLFAEGGALAGIGTFLSSALPVIGAIASVAAFAIPLISGLFKKTPRLDVDFDSIKTELGRRVAVVNEFLDPEFFSGNIAEISVKRKAGLGVGGDDAIKELIQEQIELTIESVQAILFELPLEMAKSLNDALLATEVDIDTVVAGERLLEFDAKGKKIKEKFEAFINGELQAKFLFAIRDFFVGAFESLGVLPENAQALIDEQFEAFKNAGSREARAEIGQELLATFNAFVDAFNIVSGNVNDSIGQTIQSVNNLSAKLGFDAVPSIDELRKTLGEMIENAEIDPETVQAYADLRNAIVSLMAEITSAIMGLIGKINQLNTTIVSLGGSAVDTTGFLNTASAQIQDFLGANMGNLSLSEQEGFLDQLLGVANDMLAQEQAAFEQAQQAAREAAERAAEVERAAVQQRIDGLQREKERIEETFNARIEALNEELRIAEGFAQLTESIRQTLDSILYSPESVLTGIEQVNALQGNVAALQQELAGTTDPERQMEIAGRLEEAFKTLFGAAGDAFGVNSPEFVAIFDQVTGGLSGLAEMTESRARTVEEINAEIERLTAEQNNRLASIDGKIQAAQDQLSAIGTQEVEATFQASDRVKELFEYIRTEYMRILEERFAQLEEASITGFATELEGLQTIAGISEESLVTLKEQVAETATQTGLLTSISDALASLSEFNGGSGGLRDFGRGTLAVLHGTEAVVTEAQVRAMKKHMALAAEMTGGLGGALGGALETFAESIEGAGPIGRLGRELVGAGRLTELADRLGTARITSMMEEFAGTSAGAGGGLVERLAEKLGGEDGHISGLARRAALEEVKNEMSVAISVNVNGGSGATVASVGNEIENMLVRSIRQGGRLRSAIQEAGAKRMG